VTNLSREALLAQERLVRNYLASLPGKKAGIDACWQQVQASDWHHEEMAKLRLLVHRLAGSAGSYGLEELGVAATTLDESLTCDTCAPAQRQLISRQVTGLFHVLAAAEQIEP